MPKRRSGGRGGGRLAKRRPRHLYLVFDDWLWGYSIRKIDLSSDYDSDDDNDTEQPLPPAVFRLEAPRWSPAYFAAAFGTKIVAMHPMAPDLDDSDTHPLVPRCVLPVLDVRKRALAFGPRPESYPTRPIYVSVDDDKLFALSAGSFELLCKPQLEEPSAERGARSWIQLPKPPFNPDNVTSYAVHPDGRIFFSIKKRSRAATFTFQMAKSTDEQSFEWKFHGGWLLPFARGGAHFDSDLDAWVGLSGDPDTLGFLCACDAASTNSASTDGRCPAWKISKEKLFSEDPLERHVGATLVYMGVGSRFCLVQSISIDGECVDERNCCYSDQGEEEEPPTRRFLYRVVTFSLKYDKDGDLTTGDTRRVLYYIVPSSATEFLMVQPLAFWM